MGLNIKKPNYLNTSNLNNYSKNNKNHPFNIFKNLMEQSWETKNIDIDKGEELQQKLTHSNKNKNDSQSNIDLVVDSLKNKSLITYIDAPWGSGKTYFIEKLLEWIKDEEKKNKEFKFDFNKNNDQSSSLDIDVIDAWEIYNGSNLEETLKIIYHPNLDVVETKKAIERYNESNEKLSNEERKRKLLRYGFITATFLAKTIIPLGKVVLKLADMINNNHKKLDVLKNDVENKFQEKYTNVSNDILTLSIVNSIEKKYEQNNKMIIIDNIERLSSKNRLDVINKIINWANIKGTTFIFLTNFQKIEMATTFEEDFWNKISLYETFKLTNDWKTYIDNYERKGFKLNDDLKDFIIFIIPTFFNSNDDSMDIREIKKLLDNWTDSLKGDKNKTETKDLIISLIKEIVFKNLEGLDKYFLINHSISWLSENKWSLWSKDMDKKTLKIFDSIRRDSEKNSMPLELIPLINNKMFRIQSNFFELEVIKNKENIITFDKAKPFEIRSEEITFFKKFNNFIDDNASESFQKIIKNILETRRIDNKDNYISKYIDYSKSIDPKKPIKYFEFKYNNIRKLHIYNDIFN